MREEPFRQPRLLGLADYERRPDRVSLHCPHCGERKPHVIRAGLAFCPCGRKPQLAPEEAR